MNELENSPATELTEAQLDQIASVFGLKRRENTLPVRDGVVDKMDKVWWRNEDGPELVEAEHHWLNIRNFPECYQLAKPKGQQPAYKYED